MFMSIANAPNVPGVTIVLTELPKEVKEWMSDEEEVKTMRIVTQIKEDKLERNVLTRPNLWISLYQYLWDNYKSSVPQ